MGKVKVTSKNNQVTVQIRSSVGEQLNQNMAAYLSGVAVEGFLPFYIVTDAEGFTAEYGAAGFETAKEFFKNRVIDQNTFYNFMDSSVKALAGMSAYNMEYGNVLIALDTVLIESRTGRAVYLYYPVYGYNNGKFFNDFLGDIISMLMTPSDADMSYIGRLNDMLRHPDSMSWDALKKYADSIKVMIPVMPQVQPVSQVQQIPPAPSVQQIQPVVPQIQPDSYSAPVITPVQPVNSGNAGKTCPVCGTYNALADAVFCCNCGSRLIAENNNEPIAEPEQKTCPACGFVNSSDSVFCAGCGIRMNEYKIPESELENEPETEPEKETETEEQNTDTGILIKNGHVVDPVSGTDEVIDVFIRNNIIEKIGHDINVDDLNPADSDSIKIIDADGMIVAPGLVDTHVHFRDPGFTYKEDIITGAAAAARGGFTTVVCMANTKPAVDNVETLQYIQKKGETTGIHVMQTATVTKDLKGTELVDMEALADAGAAGFTDDGIPIMDEHVLVEAMKKAAELDLPISLHEEDPEFIVRPGVNQGKVSEQLGYGGASATAEDVMVARDCMLALNTGASVCIQHISSGNSVELVRLAKKLGADVHAEATPHHFTLTEDAVLKYGTNARMNPPLRTEDDRAKIIEGIIDGTIDMIVTDHAPHSEEEKAKPLENAPSGITGLETSLALGIKSLVKPGHISLMKLMELMSKNPAEFYRMVPGSITKGSPADIVVFGENELWTVNKEDFASKASNSPFIGWELPGKVHYTICSGKIVYQA